MSETPSARPLGKVSGEDALKQIVHDLRSPLGTIKIWIHLLKEGNLSPEEEARALEMLQGSASQLEWILDQIPASP